jgi:hypothetical protein
MKYVRLYLQKTHRVKIRNKFLVKLFDCCWDLIFCFLVSMKTLNPSSTTKKSSIFSYLSDLSIIRSLQPYLTYRPYQNNQLCSYNSLEFLYNDHNHTLLYQSDLQWKNFMNTCTYFSSLKRQTIYMALNSSSSKLFLENFSFRFNLMTKILAYPSEQLEMKFRYLRKELDDDLEESQRKLAFTEEDDDEQVNEGLRNEIQVVKSSISGCPPSNVMSPSLRMKNVFSSLHSLQLFYCSISSFSSFSNIKHLTISYCNLPQIGYSSSGSLLSSSSSLSSTASSSLDYLHLSSLISLVSIHFIKCDSLSDISHFKTAPNLIKLQITKCRNINGIEQLTQLKSLSFNNGIISNITTILTSLTKLEELSIEDDQQLTPNHLLPFLKKDDVTHRHCKERKLIIVNCSQIQDMNISSLSSSSSCISFLAFHNCKYLSTNFSNFSYVRSLTLSILTHLENIDFLSLVSLEYLTILNCPSLKYLNISGSMIKKVWIYLCLNLTHVSVLEGTNLRVLDINQQSPSTAFNNGMTSIPLLSSDGSGIGSNSSHTFGFQPLQIYVHESFVVLNCYSSIPPNLFYYKGKTIKFVNIEK